MLLQFAINTALLSQPFTQLHNNKPTYKSPDKLPVYCIIREFANNNFEARIFSATLHVSDFCAERHFIMSKVPAVTYFTLESALPR